MGTTNGDKEVQLSGSVPMSLRSRQVDSTTNGQSHKNRQSLEVNGHGDKDSCETGEE